MSGPLYTGGANLGNLTTVTFANLPATAPLGAQIYVSDIGEYGAVYTGNGTAWTAAGTIEIFQRARGWIMPSLAAADAATYSQTGTVITVTSVGHNIPDTFYNTKDIYLNMGTAATGATIPPGWFSNFTYVSADSFTCVSTVSQSGTGAVNTNLAKLPIPGLSSTIPGGIIGLNGVLNYSFLSSSWSGSLNLNTKLFMELGGTDFYPVVFNQANVTSITHNSIANRDSLLKQVGSSFGTAISEIALGTVDTSVNQDLVMSLQCSAANHYIAIHSAAVFLSPS